MTCKELIALLQQFPEDMPVWVSDKGMLEGALPRVHATQLPAYDAGLDGDLVDDEYVWVDEDTDVAYLLSKGYRSHESGEVLSRDIVLIAGY